jgi:FMN phosphatase YigB (HAD superfamily)
MPILLIDVGLTLLGGPKKSPATFICETFGLPRECKGAVADIVFCQEHGGPGDLLESLSIGLDRQISGGEEATIAEYWERQGIECVPLPGAKAFCEEIIRVGYRYYVVSNLWCPFHGALTKWLPDFELSSEGSFLSYKMGARKPSDRFYSQVFSQVCVAPTDLVMIGDSLDNDIIPCVSRGAKAILMNFSPAKTGSNVDGVMASANGKVHMAKSYDECLTVLKNHIGVPT